LMYCLRRVSRERATASEAVVAAFSV
jgi:hypothetical protein